MAYVETTITESNRFIWTSLLSEPNYTRIDSFDSLSVLCGTFLWFLLVLFRQCLYWLWNVISTHVSLITLWIFIKLEINCISIVPLYLGNLKKLRGMQTFAHSPNIQDSCQYVWAREVKKKKKKLCKSSKWLNPCRKMYIFSKHILIYNTAGVVTGKRWTHTHTPLTYPFKEPVGHFELLYMMSFLLIAICEEQFGGAVYRSKSHEVLDVLPQPLVFFRSEPSVIHSDA